METTALPLPFECSEPGCNKPALFDWCVEHAVPHVEIECDGDDEDDDCCYVCGYDACSVECGS